MKSIRDSVSLSFPAPSLCVYAISFQHTIHQFIYKFDTELDIRFKLLNNENAGIPYQVYRADGSICNEKLFLLENKQGKTFIIPAYKSSKYIFIAAHNGYLDQATYLHSFNSMIDSPIVHPIHEQIISTMRTSALNSLLAILD